MGKKILVVNTAGLAMSGITTHMFNYIEKLDRSIVKIDVVVTGIYEETVLEQLRQLGCGIFFLPDRKSKVLKYSYALYNLLRKGKYDAVHVHGSSCMIAIDLFICSSARTKIIIAHSHNTQCDNPKMHHILKPWMHFLYTDALACSRVAGEWMFGKRSFTVLHNVFEYQKFVFNNELRLSKRKELGIDKEEVALVVVGWLSKVKNHSFAIDIIKRLNDNQYKLFLVGKGDLRDELARKATDLGIANQVHFLGLRSDVNELLQAMDIYLMPSLGEGLPVALLEAQASGIKCIASDKITTEVDLTGDTRFYSLNEMQTWINDIKQSDLVINTRIKRSNLALKKLQEDYDINKEILKLEKVYRM